MPIDPTVMIRAARPDDAPEIANVHVNAWREAYKGLLPDAFLEGLPLSFKRRLGMWQAMIASPEGRAIFVAESEKHGVIGFASVGPARDDEFSTSGELTTLYLLKAYQKRGLGAALMKAGFEALQRDGFASAYCWVLGGNDTIDFYRHNGARLLPESEKVEEIGGAKAPHFVCVWDSLAESVAQKFVAK